MLKNRIAYLLSLAAVSLFYVFYTGWFARYILICSLALPVLSLALTLPAALRLRLQISFPQMAQCERDFIGRIRLSLRAPYPIAQASVSFEMENAFSGEKNRDRLLFGPFRNLDEEITVSPVCCGFMSLRACKVRVYDYMGLFRLPLGASSASQTIVMPPEFAGDETIKLPDEKSGMRLVARPAGTFAEDHDVRPHREGDPLGSVHWKLSAKTRSLLVKEPLTPEEQRIMISLDYFGSSEVVQASLSKLFWLASELLQQKLKMQILYFSPQGELQTVQITSLNELNALVIRLVSQKPPQLGDKRAADFCVGADWHCHISSHNEEAAA